MKYTCLIYDPQPKPGFEGEYMTLIDDAMKKGVMHGGARLHPAESATTVKVRDGKRLLTDGPFAETKDVVNGYMIFECATLDEALEWAARIPGAGTGAVEVRSQFDRRT